MGVYGVTYTYIIFSWVYLGLPDVLFANPGHYHGGRKPAAGGKKCVTPKYCYIAVSDF